jgi:hypothetical protein
MKDKIKDALWFCLKTWPLFIIGIAMCVVSLLFACGIIPES